MIGVNASRWMNGLLVVAGLYNLAWSTFLILFPLIPYQLAGITYLSDPALIRSMGIGIGVFGAAYLIAALEPIRFWPIVLTGLMAKVISPLGFVYFASRELALWSLWWLVAINDLAWWVPFGLILASAYRASPQLNRAVVKK